MKKNIFLPIAKYLVACLVLISSSCQEKLKEDFLNPDLVTSATIEGMLTDGLQKLGTLRPAYNENWHTMVAFNDMLGTGGFANTAATEDPSWGYSPYGNAFDRMRPFVGLDSLYDQMPEGETKKNYEIFRWISDVMKDYIFYNLSDIQNDIPYSEALQGAKGMYYPKFDSQESIYTAILTRLKDISGKLSGFTLNSSYTHGFFKQNDIVNKGSIPLWRSFVNTLRLRLVIRLTNANPALAKTTIQEVLAEGVYAKDRASSIVFRESADAFNLTNSTLINQTIVERRPYLFLPQNMLKVLRRDGQPDDPRIKVLFQPDKDGNYSAMPAESADIDPIRSQITLSNLSATFPSIYNRTSFEQNTTMHYLVLTSTEAHLVLAEAAIRWPELGLTAEDEYKAAIQQSIDVYYEINSGSSAPAYSGYMATSKPAKPLQAEIDSFLVLKVADFAAADNSEKTGLIFDQRYVHHNVFKPYELWSDARRLVKELGSRVRKGASNIPFIERAPYPATLESINPNFSAVKSKNNFTSPVWWTGR